MLGKMSAKNFRMFVEKNLLCPENFFRMSGNFFRIFGDMSAGKMFLLVCPEKFLVTSPPPPRSPTILGRNINVQFACSGKLHCAPPKQD
jgi:hypothetical protein